MKRINSRGFRLEPVGLLKWFDWPPTGFYGQTNQAPALAIPAPGIHCLALCPPPAFPLRAPWVAFELSDPGLLDRLDVEHSDTFWGLPGSPQASARPQEAGGRTRPSGLEAWPMALVFPETLSPVDGRAERSVRWRQSLGMSPLGRRRAAQQSGSRAWFAHGRHPEHLAQLGNY